MPVLGSFLVWGPIALLKLMEGDTFNGFGLIIYGVIVLSLVELILNQKLISKKAKIHPILTILGVVGGLKFFGFIGIIFGPFLLALFVTMLKYLVVER